MPSGRAARVCRDRLKKTAQHTREQNIRRLRQKPAGRQLKQLADEYLTNRGVAAQAAYTDEEMHALCELLLEELDLAGSFHSEIRTLMDEHFAGERV